MRLAFVALSLLAVTAAAFLAGLPVSGLTVAGGPTNVAVSTDDPPDALQNETTIAACGGTLVAAWNDLGSGEDLGTHVGYATSGNGGNTWTDHGNTPDPAGQTSRFDPVLAADGACNFYLATAGFGQFSEETSTQEANFVSVAKSTDSGQTFSSPVRADSLPHTEGGDEGEGYPVFQDKPWIAADATGGQYDGNVYLCWGGYGNLVDLYFTRSTDGAATFESERSLSAPNMLGVNSCQVVVGPGGEVYVAWVSVAPLGYRIRRSDDGGVTFGPARTIAAAEQPGHLATCGWIVKNGNVRLGGFPFSLAVDPAGGQLYAVWTDGASDEGDVFIARSGDRGERWSHPVRVNDDNTTNDQFQPAVAVDPDGLVGVMWYDRRLDPGNLQIDVYAAFSLDEGASFEPNARITDVSFGVRPDLLDRGCYMGDYNNLVGAQDGFHLVWGDNRNLAAADRLPQPDVYSASIVAPTRPAPGSPTPPSPAATATSTPSIPPVHDTAVVGLTAPAERTLNPANGPMIEHIRLTVTNRGNHQEGAAELKDDGVLSLLAVFGLPFQCVSQPSLLYYNFVAGTLTDLAPDEEAAPIDMDVEISCDAGVESGLYAVSWVAFVSVPAHGEAPTEAEDANPEDNALSADQMLRVRNAAIPVGDANCNGAVNSIDASLILQLSAGLLEPEFGGEISEFAFCYTSADANEDFDLNSIDSAIILQYGAGLIRSLPPT